ncbi:MAG: hypothetical protein DRP65_10790 [Planctomycetota bacterium]|nr:MAG: hypothetical protein DRP65_10790 [Planctomycetota bacterium]
MKRISISSRFWRGFGIFNILLSLLYVSGCGPSLSTPTQVEAFNRAGPIVLQTSADDSGTAQNQTGHYRVMPGDILEFQMPSRLIVISSELSKPPKEFETYLSRVDDEGMIKLPIIGELNASGKTLSEIESMAIKAYYPKYVVTSPMIVCKVLEYGRQSESVFTVMGLVRQPNAFPYPPNVQYSLMEALAFAGGLDMVADPRYLKVYRQDVSGKIVSATFGIDSKSFADTARVLIKPGDIVYVDHTLRTRTNAFLANIFYIRAGVDIDANR